MNCYDYKIKPCPTCSEEVIYDMCWVKWYVDRMKYTTIKDYMLKCIKEPFHNYFYLSVAIKHHYPNQLDDFNKLLVLI